MKTWRIKVDGVEIGKFKATEREIWSLCFELAKRHTKVIYTFKSRNYKEIGGTGITF